MKSIWSPFLIAIVLSISLTLYGSDQGQFSSRQGLFSIVLPAGFEPFESTTIPIKTPAGDIIAMTYISYSQDGACMVGVSHYPEKIAFILNSKQDEMLKGAQEGALQNMKGTLLSQKDYTFQNHPARTMTFTSSAEGQTLYGQMQLISVLPRLYHILYLADAEAALSTTTVQGYFDSFQLIP